MQKVILPLIKAQSVRRTRFHQSSTHLSQTGPIQRAHLTRYVRPFHHCSSPDVAGAAESVSPPGRSRSPSVCSGSSNIERRTGRPAAARGRRSCHSSAELRQGRAVTALSVYRRARGRVSDARAPPARSLSRPRAMAALSVDHSRSVRRAAGGRATPPLHRR